MIKSRFMIAAMTAATVGLTYAPVTSVYAGDTFNTEDKVVDDVETIVVGDNEATVTKEETEDVTVEIEEDKFITVTPDPEDTKVTVEDNPVIIEGDKDDVIIIEEDNVISSEPEKEHEIVVVVEPETNNADLTFNTEDKIVTDIETVVIPTVPDTSIDVTVDDESEGPEITVEITPSTPSEPDVTTPSEADESTPSEPERSTHKTTGGGSSGGSGGGHAYVFPDDKKDDSAPVITPVVDSTPTPTPVVKEEPRKDKEEHKSELPPTGDKSDLLYASCGLSGSMLMALMLHDRKRRMTAKS